jgi:hypothetical protein
MLQCTDCGKTFGANEPVVGITAEGEPPPGSPFCVQCANRTMWRVAGQAVPLPDNPDAKKFGGATIVGFIRDGSKEDSERTLKDTLRDGGWSVTDFEGCVQVSRRDINSKAAPCFKDAVRRGKAFTVIAFPSETKK